MTGREEVFQQAMNKGHSAAWDQDWSRAAEYYRQALKVIQDHPKALLNLGLALYELGEYREALKVYQQAAKASPADPLPLQKVAELFELVGDFEYIPAVSQRAADLYLKRHDPDKAIENLTRITRVRPAFVPAHTRLALIYEKMGLKEQAVAEYLALASLLQQAGDLEKAIQSVNHALQISPDSKEAQHALRILREAKPLPRLTRSKIRAEEAIAGHVPPLQSSGVSQEVAGQELDPIAEARQKALAVLAGIIFEGADDATGRAPAASRGLQSMIRGAPEVLFSKQADQTKIMLHVSQAVDLQTRGEKEQAAEELERATEAGLEHPAAFFDLGLLRAEGERLESAQRYLQQAVNHDDFALGARLLMGRILRKMGRLQEATIHYLEALKFADAAVVAQEHVDDLLQIYEPLIEAESRQEDPATKEKLCDNIEGLVLRPGWRKYLAQAREDIPGEIDGGPAQPLGEMLTEARSSRVIESISMIHKLARSGYIRSAMEEAFYALQHAPTYLPLHVYIGDLLLQQDHLSEAISKYSMVSQTYSARGEPTRAVELLRRIIRLAPMDLKARKRLIDQLLARGKTEEAIKEFIALADVYYNLADLNRARETYLEALRLAQKSGVESAFKAQILHQIADIDLQSLDWRQALQIYEQICKFRPDDQKAQAGLVDLNFRLGQGHQAMVALQVYIKYLQGKEKTEEALAFLENLVEENPGQTSIQQYLAGLYGQMGRVEEAIRHLDSVGERFLKAGDRHGAAQVVESILALEPLHKEKYQRLLAKIKGKPSGSLK